MPVFAIYDVVKSLHIIFVISWLAGLLYLPRIFVYHQSVEFGSQSDEIFQIMERRLMRYIMNPAMILVFITGYFLVRSIGFSEAWVHIKLLLVILLASYHMFLSKCRKSFINGKSKYSSNFYRIINEVPTILMALIIFLVVLKPF